MTDRSPASPADHPSRRAPTRADTYWRDKVRAAGPDKGDLILALGFLLVALWEAAATVL